MMNFVYCYLFLGTIVASLFHVLYLRKVTDQEWQEVVSEPGSPPFVQSIDKTTFIMIIFLIWWVVPLALILKATKK